MLGKLGKLGKLRPQPVDTSSPYLTAVAPQAVAVEEDRLVFPESVLLPLSVRGAGVPGSADRPWSRLTAEDFYLGTPLVYSAALRRLAPDVMRGKLRTRRTLFEGALLALAEKTGRRPSQAEHAADQAMDAAESALAMGKPIYSLSLLAALHAGKNRAAEAETVRRTLEANLRAKGFVPQRLHYIAERALHHLQPGGILFPGFDEPALLLEEAARLLPRPTRRINPAPEAVWLGLHGHEGRDVYFSFKHGFDAAAQPPPHALTLLLGEPGSGKTTLLRLILLQRLLQGRTILSLDPEGENNALCRAMGGRVIPAGIPDDPETCLIQPLHAKDAADTLQAARFLLAALGGEGLLTPGVQAALHDAVQRRWQKRPQPMSLGDLYEALGTGGHVDAAAPRALLRQYVGDGLSAGFFDRPKALLTPQFEPGTWWNFDLSNLQAQNKELVYAALAWFMFHAITVGKQPMDVFIDEGWRLLRGGVFADLLDELGRRARKRGVGIVLATHLPADLARQSTSLSLAATSFIGRLGPDEAQPFLRSLGVPEAEAQRQAGQISRLPPRVFLAAAAGGRSGLFPVQVSVPDDWLEFFGRLPK